MVTMNQQYKEDRLDAKVLVDRRDGNVILSNNPEEMAKMLGIEKK
jgi:hypothetical protein